MTELTIGYVNVYVSDLDRAVPFYRDTLGLLQTIGDASFGYFGFEAGSIRIGVAQVDRESDQADLIGRHTGVGFVVSDVTTTTARLEAQGVEFSMPPSKQPWGGFMAMFKDPDGNVFYLDQLDGP
jgi:predicted enzyme related to lactoylglutathione lyase